MGRPLRTWDEDAVYHLFSRGSDKRVIFDEYRDYARFMAIFRRYAREFEVDCFAWALMPNHWHLLVRSPPGGLSGFVKRLNHRYSIRTNRRKERVAHLFSNRFGSVIQQSTEQFLLTLRYVVRNPVQAGLCTTVDEWRWTSFRSTVGIDATPSFLCVDEILGYFGNTREEQVRRVTEFITRERL